MTARWVFRPDYVGISKLAFLPGLGVPMMARATQVANTAKRLTDSRRVAEGILAEGPQLDSLGVLALVNAHHWTSAFVEFGTVDQPPTAMLRRAGEQGGRFTGKQKR